MRVERQVGMIVRRKVRFFLTSPQRPLSIATINQRNTGIKLQFRTAKLQSTCHETSNAGSWSWVTVLMPSLASFAQYGKRIQQGCERNGTNSISHTNPLKYKCPRCGVQTCSLACVKRHKLWSQCSGIRNPAAFRKRNELATAGSIDQDYNFITSVERSLAHADDEATARGIPFDTDGKKKHARGQTRTNIEIANSGAMVLKAPEGMSRNKQNKSRWNMKHRNFSWTIEWILPDGSNSLTNTPASKTVGEAFIHTVGGKLLRKRKLSEEEAVTQSRQDGEPEAGSETNVEGEHVEPPTPKQAKPGKNILSDVYFYLHSPNTPSAIKSLIPIQSDAKIVDVVKDRLLLEFPTIFLLYERPEMLWTPFILEADYAKRQGHLATPMLSIDEATEKAEEQDHAQSQIEARSLLESLQKDLVS